MGNVVLGFALSALALAASAQVSVDVSEHGVRVGGVNAVRVEARSGAPEAQMGAVAVLGGAVYIDGVKVAKGQTLYTSKKSGKTYRIQWGKDGNISVAEK